MKVLIVEDDESKRNQIVELVNLVGVDPEVEEARSLQSGRRAILEGVHDLVILDMTMPTFDITAEEDGGRPQAYAGRDLLRQMRRRSIDTPVLILSQFDRFGEGLDIVTLDELDAELRAAHPSNYLGAIYYDVASEGWKRALAAMIRKLQGRDST